MTAEKKSQSKSNDSLQEELTRRGREVWLAGLGALATVEEEGSKLYSQLVDRGKEFESERRKELEEVREEMTETAREQREEAISQLEEAGEETQSLLFDTVNAALERFGVPTRSEVDRLSTKVEKLSRQVDDLSRALSAETEHGSESSESSNN
jgi:poly(hydroxyalkanoate) granule-associated protein